MKKLFLLFISEIIVISFVLNAYPPGSIEKIGAKNITIVLKEDYSTLKSKGYRYECSLVNTSGKEQKVYYELSGFKTKENYPIKVDLFEGEVKNPILKYDGAPVTTSGPLIFTPDVRKILTLKFMFAPESEQYTGTLTIHIFSSESPVTSSTETITFDITRYKKPVKTLPDTALEINQGSTEPMYISILNGSTGDKPYNVTLANKSKEGPITNIIIRPISFKRIEGDKSKTKPFDTRKWKATTVPQIEIQKSKIVPLQLPEISQPGTYHADYGIEADGLEPRQLKAIVYSKHGVWLAIIALLVGSVLSYFVTRAIIIQKTKGERSRTIRRIKREMEDSTDDNQYLKERIKALINISAALNKGWIFISKDKTEDLLNQARYLLEVGKRKGEIWDNLQDIQAPYGLVEAAAEHLRMVDRLVSKYDVLALKETINSHLEKAEAYTSKDKGTAHWLQLKQKIEDLLTKNADPEVHKIPEKVKEYIQDLKNELSSYKDNTEVEYEKLKPIDQTYKKLDLITKHIKLLNGKNIKRIKKPGDDGLKALFSIIWEDENQTNWKTIEQNWQGGKVTIIAPIDIIANEVGVFTVDFGDETLNNSYLVRRGITYTWKFEKSSTGNASTAVSKTHPENLKNNSMAKCFPGPGVYGISLSISYKGESMDPITMDDIRVSRNEEIKRTKQFATVELGLSFAALVLAVLSGLQTQTVKKPDFGSFEDLLALFFWAVAFDQGKNFLGWIKGIKTEQNTQA